MKEALLYQKLDDGKVRCNLCAHRCLIKSGKAGICKVRENIDGILYTNVYGRTITQNIDPVEKKPLYHFYPGSAAYSLATPGCNFRCTFCQNWTISQITDKEIIKSGNLASPDQIVRNAIKTGCKSIAYTYTEPTIFFEYSYDTAVLAHRAGLKNIYVSNGYMTDEMLEMISPYLDAINIDLKAFSDHTYRHITGARLQPVLDSLVKVRDLGIWLEVTSLIIPGINDMKEEISFMANFIAGRLGTNIPWHLSRFFPAYKMKDVPVTPVKTLKMAKETGLEAGIKYVYIGNVINEEDMDTKCPNCGRVLIERSGFGMVRSYIREGRCPDCGQEIPGVGL
jgi:pyruvate formate lyase activating enzyme